MRTNIVSILTVLILFVAAASADVVSERFGGPAGGTAHPKAMKIEDVGGVTRLVFDLSVLEGKAVHRASLGVAGRVGQPREPIQIVAVKAIEAGKVVPAGDPLALEAPYFRSFDATAAVKTWAADPKSNLGLALLNAGGLDVKDMCLDVWYEGKPDKAPAQVEGLQAVHASGQTFLVWKELLDFRPPADKVLWLEDFAYQKPAKADGPGKNAWGGPRVGAVTLETLRGLEGFAVRTEPGKGQSLAPQKRVKKLPNVEYRVYRSKEKITPQTVASADLVGTADPLNAYDTMMIMGGHIACRGEYYDQREIPDSIFKTWTLADGRAVAPGEAFFVFTLPEGQAGKYFYAVTAWQDGVENMAVSDANSLSQAVEEKAATPLPVLQHIRPDSVHVRPKDKTTESWYAFFLAPPLANVPIAEPKRIVVEVPEVWKAGGVLYMTTNTGGAFWDPRVRTPAEMLLSVESDGLGSDVGYNEGRGTLKPYRGSQVRFYSEKHLFTVLDWAMAKWQPGRDKILGGASEHFAVRHPEFFGSLLMGPPFASGYEFDFDQKWNPAGGSLAGRLGPPDLVKGPDGGPAWDMFDLTKYLRDNIDKDIPFMGCMFSQPKDGNHGAEYGFQDDPKGFAALRDARQPYAATWGGPGLPGEVSRAYGQMPWMKTLPAFSNGSLDNNPGTGDPDAGEPWGQINAWLLWNPDDSVDTADRWEMTVWVVGACPDAACTVDITPRHCGQFKPKAGQVFTWEDKDLATGKATSGKVTADKWGLVTLKQAAVGKGKNRIVIAKAQ